MKVSIGEKVFVRTIDGWFKSKVIMKSGDYISVITEDRRRLRGRLLEVSKIDPDAKKPAQNSFDQLMASYR